MRFILLGIAWLFVALFAWSLCRASAQTTPGKSHKENL